MNKVFLIVTLTFLSGCFVYPGDIEKAERLCDGVKYVRASIADKEIIASCLNGETITFTSSGK